MTNQIDIYVDASWLTKGANNPQETGGWGAIIRTPQGLEEISGPMDDAVGNAGAELSGVKKALAFAKERFCSPGSEPVKIVLHSDMRGLKREKIAALLEGMDVEIKYRTGPKFAARPRKSDCVEMSQAHALASQAAWANRLKMQGFITLQGFRLQGEEAEEWIARMKNLKNPSQERGA